MPGNPNVRRVGSTTQIPAANMILRGRDRSSLATNVTQSTDTDRSTSSGVPGTGDVVGISASADLNIPLYDGTSGKRIQDLGLNLFNSTAQIRTDILQSQLLNFYNELAYPTIGAIVINCGLSNRASINLTGNFTLSFAGFSSYYQGEITLTNSTGSPITPTWPAWTMSNGVTMPTSLAAGVTYLFRVSSRGVTTPDLVVTYAGPGTGGTATSYVYNVKAAPYNAVGDGVTNDTTAIQNAINALVTAGGGELYFPRGDYKITAELLVQPTASLDFVARGDGINISRIICSTAGQRGFNIDLFNVGYTPLWSGQIFDLSFVANAACLEAVLVDYGPATVSSHSESETVVERVGVYGGTSVFTNGIHCRNAWNTLISQCYLTGPGLGSGYGVYLEDRCMNSTISDTQINSFGSGIRHYATTGENMEGLFCTNVYMVPVNRGFDIDGSAGTGVRATLFGFSNCHVDARDTGATPSYAARFIRCSAVFISNCLLIAGNGLGGSRVIYGGRLYESTISNNQIYGPVGIGIELNDAFDVVVGATLGSCGNAIIANTFRLAGATCVDITGSHSTGNRAANNTEAESDTTDSLQNTLLNSSGGNTSNILQCTFTGGRATITPSSDQTIANSSSTVLTCATITNNQFSMATSTRHTVPANCKQVQLVACVKWASNSTGYRYIQIRKNGGSSVAGTLQLANLNTQMTVMTPILDIAGGDYFELLVEQNSGGNLDVLASGETSFGIEIKA